MLDFTLQISTFYLGVLRHYHILDFFLENLDNFFFQNNKFDLIIFVEL